MELRQCKPRASKVGGSSDKLRFLLQWQSRSRDEARIHKRRLCFSLDLMVVRLPALSSQLLGDARRDLIDAATSKSKKYEPPSLEKFQIEASGSVRVE